MSSLRRYCVIPALVVFGSLHGLSSLARGQGGAVAFEPIPAPALSGQTLTTTPVVSPDRRYVRLSVNAYFNAVNGFTNFTTPLGAVSGGGGLGGAGGGALGGAGGGGGFGGAGGGGIGAGGGGGMGAGGGTAIFSAGMNGVFDPAGRAVADSRSAGDGGFAGGVKAGPLPPWDAMVNDAHGDSPLTTEFAPAWVLWDVRDDALNEIAPGAVMAHSRQESARQDARLEHTLSKPHHRAARSSASIREKAKRSRKARIAEANDVEPIVKPKKPD